MNKFTLLKTAILLSGLTFAYQVYPTDSRNQLASCTNISVISEQGLETIRLQCNPVPQTSWKSWFSGQSRSAQFHFIDLMELLNRFRSDSAA